MNELLALDDEALDGLIAKLERQHRLACEGMREGSGG